MRNGFIVGGELVMMTYPSILRILLVIFFVLLFFIHIWCELLTQRYQPWYLCMDLQTNSRSFHTQHDIFDDESMNIYLLLAEPRKVRFTALPPGKDFNFDSRLNRFGVVVVRYIECFYKDNTHQVTEMNLN